MKVKTTGHARMQQVRDTRTTSEADTADVAKPSRRTVKNVRIDTYRAITEEQRNTYMGKVNQHLQNQVQNPGIVMRGMQQGFDFTAGIMEGLKGAGTEAWDAVSSAPGQLIELYNNEELRTEMGAAFEMLQGRLKDPETRNDTLRFLAEQGFETVATAIENYDQNKARNLGIIIGAMLPTILLSGAGTGLAAVKVADKLSDAGGLAKAATVGLTAFLSACHDDDGSSGGENPPGFYGAPRG